MFKSIVSIVVSFAIFVSSGVASIFAKGESLRIVVPENWEMQTGDSRTLECVFGNKVTDRVIEWSVSPEDVASVDCWGRVTALSVGQATITATAGKLTDSVQLNVTSTPTKFNTGTTKTDYKKDGFDFVDNFQKIVTRYPLGSEEVPYTVRVINDYSKYQSVTTPDGAFWEITNYGVLRTDKNAPTERDREQRFMGDRYFYSADTTDGKVLAIFSDGDKGIWTVMANGYTHIEMVSMSGEEKAAEMSNTTQEIVARRGYVANAYQQGNGTWWNDASDNDGLWTSMYGAGELMRYATLRDDPDASEEEIAAARKTAVQSAEAILMLHYISMRTGTIDAYVRYQENGKLPGDSVDRWFSAEALKEGGNYSYLSPEESPASLFEKNYANLLFTGNTDKIMNKGMNTVVDPSSWASTRDEANSNVNYAKQKRLLEGFVARTYWLETEESYGLYDNIYWQVNEDNTATGVSTKSPDSSGYYLNNEDLRGFVTDASGEIPERLWNNLVGEDALKSDIIYKGDTSADELIGHAFIFKLMYDILADEDPELKELMVTAIDNLAQHLVDNGYMLVDGSGQHTTWSNFSRTSFNVSSSIPMAPLHTMVVLSVFKTAAYITGYEKWENEYRMAALDPAYEYAKIVSQQSERLLATVSNMVAEEVSPLLAIPLKLLSNSDPYTLITRLIINYSDEEMAMLGFYTLFQLEDDKELLSYYKNGIDDWWSSMRYSENPLWYYVYQLAYPNKNIKDAYGNNIMETAAWSLSRHPVSTRKYSASNAKRDDIATINLSALGLDVKHTPSYSLTAKKQPTEISEDAEILDIIKFVLSASKLEWAVAAPDERALHKYNHNSYILHEDDYEPNCMESSTTYTLPYWLGRYHGMLNK